VVPAHRLLWCEMTRQMASTTEALRHTLQSTALVHEAYLRLLDSVTWAGLEAVSFEANRKIRLQYVSKVQVDCRTLERIHVDKPTRSNSRPAKRNSKKACAVACLIQLPK